MEFSSLTFSFGGLVSFDVLDRVRLQADLAKGLFTLEAEDGVSPETLDHCLYDLSLPRLLAHDGALVIHGGLCATPTGTVGFMGPSGRGKSTLVAGLDGIGLRLMGDDAFILDPVGTGYDGRRVYPSLRLFPDSVDSLFQGNRPTTPMADYSTKRRVAFDAGPDSGPLLALFRLAEPGPEVAVTRLSMAAACMALVSNSFVLDVDDMAETRMKFGLASAAAQVIPVYDLTYPRDYARLPDVQDAILDTLALSRADLSSD